MTLQEKADKHRDQTLKLLNKRLNALDKVYYGELLRQSYLAGATESPLSSVSGPIEREGWVRVEDGLPEMNNEEYLVFGKGVVSTLNYINKKWYSDVYEKFAKPGSVTHWMPLPKPPVKKS